MEPHALRLSGTESTTSSVGILELHLSVWQTSTASWNKAASAKTVPITINLPRGKEGETHTERELLGVPT